jgi:hypothetical protein
VAENPGFGGSKTNREIREWYFEQVARIPILNDQWIEEGLSVQVRAYRAWEIRHNSRLRVRTMMGKERQIHLLKKRDLAKYGNPDGPTFDSLVENNEKLGLVGAEVYEAIIVSSMNLNIGVNKRLRLK